MTAKNNTWTSEEEEQIAKHYVDGCIQPSTILKKMGIENRTLTRDNVDEFVKKYIGKLYEEYTKVARKISKVADRMKITPQKLFTDYIEENSHLDFSTCHAVIKSLDDDDEANSGISLRFGKNTDYLNSEEQALEVINKKMDTYVKFREELSSKNDDDDTFILGMIKKRVISDIQEVYEIYSDDEC